MGRNFKEIMNNLLELQTTEALKIIFVGGKGGVGKTTTSASLAVQMSKHRRKVLLLSTDPAHNLSDAFEQQLGTEPTLIDSFDNLYALELDHAVTEGNLGDNNSDTFDDIAAANYSMSKFMSSIAKIPGFDEIQGLFKLLEFTLSDEYDCIIIDTAPTGHTLRMLSLPGMIYGFRDIMNSPAMSLFDSNNPLLANFTNGMDLSEVKNMFRKLFTMVSQFKAVLENPDQTTFVVVCIPEFLPIFETERLVQNLTGLGIDCSCIVLNHCLYSVDDVNLPFMKTEKEVEESQIWQQYQQSSNKDSFVKQLIARQSTVADFYMAKYESQKPYIKQIKSLYSEDFNICPIQQQSTEMRGIQNLTRYGEMLMREENCLPQI